MKELKMKELNKKIIAWAKDRDLDKKGTVEGQSIKTAEEMAELIKAISKRNIELIQDSIGDIHITLVIGNMIDKDFDMNIMYESNERKIKKLRGQNVFYNKEEQIRHIANKIVEIIKDKYEIQDIRGTQYLLMRLAEIYNLNFKDCVESAYGEIANRKGKTINGTFVKEEDLHA